MTSATISPIGASGSPLWYASGIAPTRGAGPDPAEPEGPIAGNIPDAFPGCTSDVPTPVSAGGNVPVNPTGPSAPTAPTETPGDGWPVGDRPGPVPVPGAGEADDFAGGGDEDGDRECDGAGEGDATETLAPALGGVQGSSVGTPAVALSDTAEPAGPPGADTSSA
jgi:hypothetical protein